MKSRRQHLAVEIEYDRQPTGDHGSVPTVLLGGFLILTGTDCTARLLDAQEVGWRPQSTSSSP